MIRTRQQKALVACFSSSITSKIIILNLFNGLFHRDVEQLGGLSRLRVISSLSSLVILSLAITGAFLRPQRAKNTPVMALLGDSMFSSHTTRFLPACKQGSIDLQKCMYIDSNLV